MKHAAIIKFLAVLLCAAALLGLAGSGLSFLLLEENDLLGSQDFNATMQAQRMPALRFSAEEYATNWASEHLGGIPKFCLDTDQYESAYFVGDKVFYTLTDGDGKILDSTYDNQEVETTYEFSFPYLYYHQLWDSDGAEAREVPTQDAAEDADEAPENVTEAAAMDEDWAPKTEEKWAFVETLPDTVYSRSVYSEDGYRHYQYEYTEELFPECTVTVHLAKGAERSTPDWMILRNFWLHQKTLLQILVVSVLLFLGCALYLCGAAGHSAKAEPAKASGINALPLDLYGFFFLCYALLCAIVADEFGRSILQQSLKAAFYLAGGLGFGGCLIFVGLCFAFAAQVKMPDYYWWHNLAVLRLIRLGCRLVRKLWEKAVILAPKCWAAGKHAVLGVLTICRWLLALAQQIAGKLWRLCKQLLGWAGRRMEHFFSLLPLTWQWLLAGFLLIFILSLSFAGRARYVILGVSICVCLVMYVSGAFGTLLEAAHRMRSGDLQFQVDDKYLVGCFKSFAAELNGLADVAMVAAQNQLKSERMKTELITNVSHDIKTPLTSIINYVDLLAKPHTPEEEKAYLEVLSRQSARMKKLIEDLLEMSKATTGNIPVEITEIDANEAIHQALGEFSDKLDAAGLTPIFRQCEPPITILADGRLLWRAMSNVLSNAVKYAMPGTRLYIDVNEAGGQVLISLKNISRAELNVTADELLERFVRGDTSRNTEGSGLGLNIAQSLMELQKGQLQLLVDGDLFKVTLIFPKA